MSAAFDREKATQQLKQLKQKAKAARAEGKRDLARSFQAGAKRLGRKLRAHPAPPPPAEAKEEKAAAPKEEASEDAAAEEAPAEES